MTKYRVTVRQDAWVNHTADIEAESKEQACEIAERAWKAPQVAQERGDPPVTFEEGDISAFDDIVVDEDEVEVLDENGEVVEGSS